VRDTGIGIPADKIGLIFDKFSQVDASSTRQYGGTGLGLAISRQLAEMMGGEAGVNSENGKGSEFWFTARFDKQAGGLHSESILPADLRGVRVLIVDDNATNREILTTRLTSWGMRPSEVQDGYAAIQALCMAIEENDPFRIAVIDMQMPGMDGETLGRIIQADYRMAGTRMVMLTSMGTRGDARRFQEIGFAAYTNKPIRHNELKAMLSLALAEQGGTEPVAQIIATRHTARETMDQFADRKARILLAEDNIINQQVTLGILKKLGLHADAVTNGAEAVKALEITHYDLVLMDVQMPVMDGLEATRRIRNNEKIIMNYEVGIMKEKEPEKLAAYSSIPIIAMTAHAMQGDRERFLKAGMNDYVAKPVDPAQLAEVLDLWLKGETGKFKLETGAEKEDRMSSAKLPAPRFEYQNSTIFDKADMMTRLLGDEDLAQKVIEKVLVEMPKQLMLMKEFVDQGQTKQAGVQAHKIRGAAGNIGSPALQEIAHAMEQAGTAEEINLLRTLMPEMEKQFELLKEAMEASEP
jgi:CheY-like chemotaxis protein